MTYCGKHCILNCEDIWNRFVHGDQEIKSGIRHGVDLWSHIDLLGRSGSRDESRLESRSSLPDEKIMAEQSDLWRMGKKA